MGVGHLKYGRSRMRGNNLLYEIFRGGGVELQGLSPFISLVLGSLSITALTFLAQGGLLSRRLIFLNRMVCDYDCLGCCSDIVLQR